jgi:sarcosine oxidase
MYDTIIIGAGAVGSSTAFALAKRGQKVLLLEQFTTPHERGSHHGHSRIFRFAYDDPDYARLAMRALPAWRELEQETGQNVLHLFGGLDIGQEGNPSLENTAQTLSDIGASVERLSAATLMQRWSQWRVPKDWVGIYSVDAGIVQPSRAVELMVALARKHGATLLENCTVHALESGAVQTSAGKFQAKQIVVAAGAWLPKLVPSLTQLTVTLEGSLYFAPDDIGAYLPERFPIFIDHSSLAYGFPVQGLPAVKLGLHQSGANTDADSREFAVPQAMLESAQAWLSERLPHSNWRNIQSRTCLYTNTPSHDFIFDKHPELENVLIASPCSGHGFKFSSYLGEIVADKLEGKPNEFDLPRFRMENALQHGSAKLLSRGILAQ